MNTEHWPTSLTFAQSLQDLNIAFRDDSVKHLREVELFKKGGRIIGNAGNFAVVYKGTFPDGKQVAIRVFSRDPMEKIERYREVGNYLRQKRTGKGSPFVPFEFFSKGIFNFSAQKFYPLIVMEWVEGEELYKWLTLQCGKKNNKNLQRAAERWLSLISYMKENDIAHGDLQHANIMFTDSDEMKLVDYDGMYVPALVNQPTLEYGVKPYQHPLRDGHTKLDLRLDDFSSIVIYVGLFVLSVKPDLWKKYVLDKEYDKLLFTEEDLEKPESSELFAELKKYSPKAYELSCRLSELYNGPLEDVPALTDFAFTWESVYNALESKDFDEALRLCAKAGDEQVPADLIKPLENAQERSDCFRKVEKALKQKDENVVASSFDILLLSDWPKIASLVSLAKAAIKLPPIHRKLMELSELGKWQEFEERFLDDRTAIQNYKDGMLAKQLWELYECIAKCNCLLKQLQLETNQLAPDIVKLQKLESQLDREGPHPEKSLTLTRKIEFQIKRETQWRAWNQLRLLEISEENDKQIIASWIPDSFDGWKVAETKRRFLEDALDRLALIEKLNAIAPPANACLEDLEVFIEIGQALPASYEYGLKSKVADSVCKIETVVKVQELVQQNSAVEIPLSELWGVLISLNAQHLIEPSVRARCELASLRAPLVTELTKLPNPKEDLGRFDHALVELWDENLLAECCEAEPYIELHERAVRRLQLIKRIQSLVVLEDDFGYVELSSHPDLQNYVGSDLDYLVESAPPFSVLRDDKRRQHLKIAEIKESISLSQTERFIELYDEELLERYYDRCFSEIEDDLAEFILEQVLSRLHLGKLKIGDPLFYQRDFAIARWHWPSDSLLASWLTKCCLGISSAHLSVPKVPLKQDFFVLETVKRDQYEKGQGKVIPLRADWNQARVTVWGVISIGGRRYYTNPLALGILDCSKVR